jgi:hypothetical protein
MYVGSDTKILQQGISEITWNIKDIMNIAGAQ